MEGLVLGLGVVGFLVASAYFSGMETGLLSVSPLKLQIQAHRGDGRASLLYGLLQHKPKMIVLVLVGTNAANTLYSLAGEKFIQSIWAGFRLPPLDSSASFLAATLVLTPPLVVFAEIFPKSLFLAYSFSLTKTLTPPFYLLSRLATPIIAPLWFLIRFITGGEWSQREYSKEYINLLAQTGLQAGTLNPHQETLIRRILRLSSLPIGKFSQKCPKFPELKSTMHRRQVFKAISGKPRSSFFVQHKGNIWGIVSPLEIWRMSPHSTLESYSSPLPVLDASINSMEAVRKLLHAPNNTALIDSESSEARYVSLWDLVHPKEPVGTS